MQVCVTMETGFQVVVGAAFGCQLVPPVILFSPGWLQWISLRINRAQVSSSSRLRAETGAAYHEPSLTSSSCHFQCPGLESNIHQAAISLRFLATLCPNERVCSLVQINRKQRTHCRQGWPAKSQGHQTQASLAADWTAGWSQQESALGCLQ